MTTKLKKNNPDDSIDALQALRAMGHASLTFGRMLRSRREGEELSAVEFASLLGISKQDLNNIESGRTQVTVQRAKDFALKLGFPPAHFVCQALRDLVAKVGLEIQFDIRDAKKRKSQKKSKLPISTTKISHSTKTSKRIPVTQKQLYA